MPHGVRAQDVTCAVLEGEAAFKGLTEREALYAYFLSEASWAGSPICSFQTSPSSVPLLSLLRLVFAGGYDATREKLSSAAGAAWEAFLAYSVACMDALGNYRSFGDTLLLPTFAASDFLTILKASSVYEKHKALMDELWDSIKVSLYDTSPRNLQLGLGEKGVSSYYSACITEAEASAAHRYLASKGYPQAYNARVFGMVESGDRILEVRLASCLSLKVEGGGGEEDLALTQLLAPSQPMEFEGMKIRVVRGDHSVLMERVAGFLRQAGDAVANSNQGAMLAKYAESFSTGSQTAFISGSELWVKDKNPVVESYLGFIESYQDPMGISGQWEGFVAVVNKETSKKFTALVENAPSLLPLLPWGAQYEKEVFLKPDFTALEVLAFASSGVPAGINIPNFDSVRQKSE